MKLCFVLLAALAATSANPRKYSYVSTVQFEDGFNRISDRDMHPEPTENKYARLINAKASPDELTSEYWLNLAKDVVTQQLQKQPNTNKAKNVIMFLGDGMSHPSIAAARVLMGGEELKLSFEHFPFTASSKTYCVDKQVADSACTATAYLSGIKANYETIGVNARAQVGNCADNQDVTKQTESIASWAMKAGKQAGFVTTTRVTHASPSGVYAHTTHRDWENDAEVVKSNCNPATTDDIAEQLVHGEVAKKLKVMMGGGSRNFIDSSVLTQHGGPGYRVDGKDLIAEWKAMNLSRTFIGTRAELMAIEPEKIQQILGIFNDDHIRYNLDIQRENLQEIMPSLTDMTLKAIDILSQSDEGYFLFVEGGRIDHGHHKNEAKFAIDETVQFSKAIEAAMEKIDLSETLVVVTADHGHVMTLAGYAPRGNDIFGFAGKGDDDIPYMTLSYANGLGFYDHFNQTHGGRINAEELDRSANGFKFPTTLPVDLESHGGEDVGVWAAGPWAHLFQGTIEQNVIPHIMAYASCIGEGLTMCQTETQ